MTEPRENANRDLIHYVGTRLLQVGDVFETSEILKWSCFQARCQGLDFIRPRHVLSIRKWVASRTLVDGHSMRKLMDRLFSLKRKTILSNSEVFTFYLCVPKSSLFSSRIRLIVPYR